MARGPQAKPADTDAAGADDTVAETLLNSAPADDQASTVTSTVVNSPPLSPQASDADTTAGTQVVIYPVRSYLDGKEIRQAGGAGYASPKHEALLLIAKGLATDTDPKA
jgi:hypothetical protein